MSDMADVNGVFIQDPNVCSRIAMWNGTCGLVRRNLVWMGDSDLQFRSTCWLCSCSLCQSPLPVLSAESSSHSWTTNKHLHMPILNDHTIPIPCCLFTPLGHGPVIFDAWLPVPVHRRTHSHTPLRLHSWPTSGENTTEPCSPTLPSQILEPSP